MIVIVYIGLGILAANALFFGCLVVRHLIESEMERRDRYDFSEKPDK